MTAFVEAVVLVVPLVWRVGTLRLMLMSLIFRSPVAEVEALCGYEAARRCKIARMVASWSVERFKNVRPIKIPCPRRPCRSQASRLSTPYKP